MRTLRITVLTQDDCVFCVDAIAILDRLAAEYPLAVETIAFQSAEGEALAIQGGIYFPPGVLIAGDAVSYGRPSERLLRRELERRL